ncbi:membrane progestin receptor delta isoform X1 [Podarcis raffonei]|uniref:membrane progestin receptor delta isoform X1 n=1 Tax=Podarcis raffonei TaxID=65483 RepID=UPI002329496E|nr:membrane progestin receptor delta isoform X1 [Podarcis raffonei]XP_053225576.1 membrane progestin receptor delta isoform X1 [Podarcis raffonei]XP_053225577.1 membrane progestin receptor delta isoform X1 [Podarcis raffonei]
MLTIKLPQIFRVHQVPRIFWEDGIISGYRHPKSSALDCVLSSFQLNNETINIWTHFLPTWYFLWRFLMLSYSLDFWRDTYSWPFLAYMVLVCLYPFTSSCAHTFSTMSTHARHICYFLDYGALSLYSLEVAQVSSLFIIGCAITYGAYAMPDVWVDGPLHHCFVPLAALNSFICTSLSCYSRFLELECPSLCKILRTAAFAYPFLFDNIPLFYRLLFCFGEDCAWNDSVPGYFYHLLFAALTGFLFASHLPERLAPGRFDYIGHSHQLFHICAVVGTHFQLESVLWDLHSRRAWLSAHAPAATFTQTFAILGAALLGNLALVAAFTMALLRSSGTTLILQSNVPEVERPKEQ